jgi:uncharacterized membrane protein YbaN (DUF454 family)
MTRPDQVHIAARNAALAFFMRCSTMSALIQTRRIETGINRDGRGITVESSSGRIRLQAAQLLKLHGDSLLNQLVEGALRHSAVESVLIERARGTLTIIYDGLQRTVRQALVEIARCLCEIRRDDRTTTAALDLAQFRGSLIRVDRLSYGPARQKQSNARPYPIRATGLVRLAKIAAAGGCFSVAVAGLVVPSVPSLSFCLATGYFLIRSSPELNERLRNSRAFGSVVRDFQDYGGLRASVKSEAIALALGTCGASILMSGYSPAALVTIAVAMIDLWLVLRLPTVPMAVEA